ncbi:alpha/beta hydrolase-fold protein [Oscillibacter sp.]|uniref:alpha/beta hydrolase n=1 Tax=Oscillibacter sp. TaxID=1945593 RepID=UPI002620267A|nr:alpha/beta hydrolase-fold protein [Oscillibacter sp.]MDD3346558.1 alpha/beta hydrolase-fold protein [Oscillibacter sp.]
MAVLNLDLYSYELAMNTQVTMLLPERRGVPHESRDGAPYFVLYLLHGHGQDHTSWLRLTRLESYLQNTDVIVVMPNGGRGCYVDGAQTHRYGTYLTKELPLALKNWFHISPKREETFIAGMSMGGYGALRAALSCPEQYGAAAGLSTAVRMDRLTELPPSAADKGLAIPTLSEVGENLHRVFGTPADYESTDFSLKKLARRLNDAAAPAPRLMQLCGDDDPLLADNEDFAAFIKAECPRLSHTFHVTPGIHDFDFWDREIRTALQFFGLLP